MKAVKAETNNSTLYFKNRLYVKFGGIFHSTDNTKKEVVKDPLFGDRRMNEFELGKKLGKGQYGLVKLCKEKGT